MMDVIKTAAFFAKLPRSRLIKNPIKNPIKKLCCARASGLPEAHAEGAPVAAANDDRRGEVLHQHELAAAHVAPVGLQQERLGAGGDLSHRAVVEQAAVAAIGVVPD